MTEAWILETLGNARAAARSQGLMRLAEHLDDAMLLAASEYHEAAWIDEIGADNVLQGADTVRIAQRPGLH